MAFAPGPDGRYAPFLLDGIDSRGCRYKSVTDSQILSLHDADSPTAGWVTLPGVAAVPPAPAEHVVCVGGHSIVEEITSSAGKSSALEIFSGPFRGADEESYFRDIIVALAPWPSRFEVFGGVGKFVAKESDFVVFASLSLTEAGLLQVKLHRWGARGG